MGSSPLSRRDFIKLSGSVAGTAVLASSATRLVSALQNENLSPGAKYNSASQETIVPTVCLLCPSGCGMLARVTDGNLVKLEGNPMHPINLGALCPKGQAAPELLYNPDRLTGPLLRVGERGKGEWQPITWDQAVQMVAGKLVELRNSGHPERFALLYGETRGYLRDFLNRFMATVGSPNAISHDSLNIEAAKLASLYTQGVYDLPNYDLENSNYVLSFGASLLEAGRSPQRTVAGYSYMRRGRADRGKIVVIDPRQGVSGAKADEWIPIKPGTDAALALSIAHVIITTGQFDSDFVHNYAFGFEDFTDDQGQTHKGFKNHVLENFDPRRVESITGVPATTIARIAGEFSGNPPAVAILPGKGGLLNGGFGGISAGMAIHALNALVGSIEKPGGILTQRYMACKPWTELPPDPIAEQGRNAERVDGARTKYKLANHAYQAVADRIANGYPVDVLFLYDANPVFETPSGWRFAQAFEKVPFIVSFSSMMDETAEFADLVLPEPTFLERWQADHIEGLGYPGIGLRQPVVEPLYDTMHSGDFLIQVAKTIGGPVAKAFAWESYEEMLKDRLQNIGTDWETLTQLGVWLTPGYHFSRRGSNKWINEVIGKDRQNSPRDGRFDFYSRELHCLIGDLDKDDFQALGSPLSGDAFFTPHFSAVTYAGDETEYPLVLNVVTLMSLGPNRYAANMPSLQEVSGMTVGERWKNWLEMNPETAHELGLYADQLVWVESLFGRLQVKLKLVPGLRPDVVNMPYNQGHNALGRFARNRGANPLALLNPATEPLSGLASFTNTRVKVYRV